MAKKTLTIEKETEEITTVKRTDVKETPFTIIEIEGKFFGALANYRITEEYKTFIEVEQELKKITWNRITQVMGILIEILKTNKVN